MADSKDADLADRSIKSAAGAVGDIIYTVIFDICNEVIASGADQDKTLECANTVLNKYVGGGLKVRKKPAPRAKPAKAPPKDKQIDTLTAASRKLHNLTSNVTWLVHPENDEYSYTTSVKLANGYPVRNNITRKVVLIATNDASAPLTVKDAKIALSLGLDVDYDAVVQ